MQVGEAHAQLVVLVVCEQLVLLVLIEPVLLINALYELETDTKLDTRSCKVKCPQNLHHQPVTPPIQAKLADLAPAMLE